MLLGFFLSIISAYDELDFELFNVHQQALKLFPQTNIHYTNWYIILGCENYADERKVKKAYRHISLKYHPDKIPKKDPSSLEKVDLKALKPGKETIKFLATNMADPHEYFSLVTVIYNTFKHPHKKERYNHYFRQGMPILKDGEYRVKRYQPSVWFVFAFLFIASVGFHGLLLFVKDVQLKNKFGRIPEAMDLKDKDELKKMIKKYDLTKEEIANKTLLQLKEEVGEYDPISFRDIWIFKLFLKKQENEKES